MQKGLVSVVIPNYNYSHYLREAIDGVLGQTYQPIEIVVVDDGSSDGSRDVLESYGSTIKAIFQQNHGVSQARNTGVEASDGEFLAFLDADDLWLPKKVERQVERFVAEPELGLVHVGVREIDGEGKDLREKLSGGEGRIADQILMLTDEGVLGGGSGFMVPRAVFDDIGGFDVRLSTSADWDLLYRIADRYAVGFVSEVLLKYRVHGSNMHANVAVMERDMMLAFEKAFENGSDPNRRTYYGNLYKNLSGSYYHAGDYPAFLRTAFRALSYRPANILYFIQFPLRRMRQRRKEKI
jgi:glycosyltransferase involved in cell wall biosynthesis